jgi:hypothetical protein
MSIHLSGAAGDTTVSLPAAQSGAFLHLPLFRRAALLDGHAFTAGVEIRGIETLQFGKSPVDLMLTRGAHASRDQVDLDATAFARLLAKIGYGYAVYEYGYLELNRVFVLPLIFGKSDDGGMWVGSNNFTSRAERRGADQILASAIEKPFEQTHEHVLISRVKLFATAGTTGYEIVICGISALSRLQIDPPA